MVNNLVIGLGNLVLCDDAVGPLAVRAVKENLGARGNSIDFKECYASGIDMLFELAGYKRVLIVDSIEQSEQAPGSCLELVLDDLKGLADQGFVNTHGLNLPTLWELGGRLGFDMPEECRLLAIAVTDNKQFSETLSGELQLCFPDIVKKIQHKILSWDQ